MSALDNSTPLLYQTGTLKIIGGGSGEEVTLTFEQGTLTWERPGRTKVEARERGRHASTPVVNETEDGNISWSFDFLVTSYEGVSNTHAYEALTKTGKASGWTSVGNGNAHQYKLEIAAATDTGGSQVITLRYCTTEGISSNLNQDGMGAISASGIDYENEPDIT